MRVWLPIVVLFAALSSAEAARRPSREVRVKVRVPAATYRVKVAPPAVREEGRVRAPSPRHVWAPGYWRWNGRRHLWVSGGWRLPPAGYRVWIGPRWLLEGGVYVFHPGYWGTDENSAVVPPELAVDAEDVYADTEPPPPQVETQLVAPSTHHLWIGGHWEWRAGRYVWAPGRWEAARAGFVWEPAGWERDGGRWHFRPGRWRAQ